MQESFDTVDYVLFIVTLMFSATIGLYFAFKESCAQRCKRHIGEERGNSSVDVSDEGVKEQLLGGSKMPVFPTSLSLLTSFLSGVTLLGIPVETYKRGVLYWFSRIIGTQVALFVAIFFVLPIIYELKPLSVYQYFEARFESRLIRRCASVLYLLFMVGYMGIVLFAPSIALSGITGVDAWVFFITTGLVCCVYTSLGGLRAVVWTDTFQAFVMVGGVLTLYILGCMRNGGLLASFQTAIDHGRFDGLTNFDPNPFQYMTVWTSILGGIGFWFNLLTFNQISVQRYLSLGSLRNARKCLLINLPGYAIMCTLADLTGLIMFTYYIKCDPISTKIVDSADQLVIHYALQTMGTIPGLPGIFLACLFSGTLSTISSGMNSMACVTWEDFLSFRYKNISATWKTRAVKLLAMFYGLLAIAMAFAAAPLGGILKACMSVMGAIGGPMVGLFILGMFFPRANKNGALIGMVVSIVLTAWIAVGNIVYKPYAAYQLEVFTTNCSGQPVKPVDDWVKWNTNAKPEPAGVPYLYTLSEISYPIVGIFLVILVGWPASYLFPQKKVANFAGKPLLTVFDIYSRKFRKRATSPEQKGHQKAFAVSGAPVSLQEYSNGYSTYGAPRAYQA